MAQWFCDSCNTLQYEEDLGRTPAHFDEPSWLICGFCESDEVCEMDVDEALSRLNSTIRYLASQAWPERADIGRKYIDLADAMCEYLEEL